MASDLTCHAKILIIDDELPNVRLLERILQREGYEHVSMTTDPRHAVAMFADDQPDLVLLDLNMPHHTGYEVMKFLLEATASSLPVPIIVLTADATPEAKLKALSGWASDFLTKPFDNIEVALRIKQALRTRFLQLELQNQNKLLDERVRERTEMLQATIAELRKAQGQVVKQERLRALGMMATGIAHDFNNLLSLILGYGELLLQDEAAESREKTERYLLTLIGAAQDGARMVNRLAQFQRPRSADDLQQAVSLARLVPQAVAFTMPKWQEEARANGINIEVITELDEEAVVTGDQSEIRDLLTNLIFNSVDAMPVGGKISIRARREHEFVLLEVEDTGVGMTAEIKERCLEPFFTTKGEGGSGLGLAMIYGIVQRHAGALGIRSEPGAGTRFQIRLPTRTDVRLKPVSAVQPSCDPLNILVVDDQPVLREILTEYLEMDCHRVTTAENGDEAIRLFQKAEFDLVITDKAMPGMSGEQLAAALHEMRAAVVIILLTGFAESGISSSTSPGITAVLGKPITLTPLRHAITEVMGGGIRKTLSAAPVPSL